jgi:transcriptional regulator with XRE-family HTH domain
LAKRAGCRTATISDLERGICDPRYSTSNGIAVALGCSVAELLTNDNGDLHKNLDADLDAMDRGALLDVAKAMRAAIRAHRDASGHALCWHWPGFWALLPDVPKGGQVVPDWPQFLRGCIAYRTALDRELATAPRSEREYDG